MENQSKAPADDNPSTIRRFVSFLRNRPILLWSCVFLLLRIFFLLANDGLIFEADREDITNGAILFKEEFNSSTPARELLRGNSRMLWGLSQCGYGATGGEFYQVLLLTGIFGLLGDSFYAVKALPLVFTFFTFFILLTTIEGYFGKRAAHFFGPLSILGYPFFLLPSFNAMGNHQEAALFISLGFMALSYLLFDDRRAQTIPAFLLLGLASGFGFFYNTLTASFLIWLAPVGIAAFARTWKKQRFALAATGAFVFLLGLAAGFSPYLPVRRLLIVPMNIDLTLGRDLSAFEGIGMPGYPKASLRPEMMFLQTFSKLEFTARGFRLLFREAPVSMYFEGPDRRNLLYAGLLGLLLGIFGLILLLRSGPGGKRTLPGLALLLILIHMVLVAASSQSLDLIGPNNILGYRYLMPVLPFLFFWMAGTLSLAAGALRRPLNLLAFPILIGFLLLGISGYRQHLAPSKFLAYQKLEGFSYQALAIGAGDYFREYPGPVEVQCEQIRLYMDSCDPQYRQQVDQAVDNLCADQGRMMKNF